MCFSCNCSFAQRLNHDVIEIILILYPLWNLDAPWNRCSKYQHCILNLLFYPSFSFWLLPSSSFIICSWTSMVPASLSFRYVTLVLLPWPNIISLICLVFHVISAFVLVPLLFSTFNQSSNAVSSHLHLCGFFLAPSTLKLLASLCFIILLRHANLPSKFNWFSMQAT